MDSEKVSLLSLGDSAPSSPNVPVVQPLVQTKSELTLVTSTPLSVPAIEVEVGTPVDPVSPSRHRPDLDPSRLESRLHQSGSRHSLSKVFTQQHKKKEQRRQKSSTQLPAHGEVQRMEQSLLKLLKEFNSGELRGFDSAYSLEQMESVRDQQETLARKHFELGAQQDLHPLLSDDGLKVASDNMNQLITSLETLSVAIGNLSCLDRMVDPGIRVVDEVVDPATLEDNESHRHGTISRGDTTERSSRDDSGQFSRRSTISNQTDVSALPLDEMTLVPTIIEDPVYQENIAMDILSPSNQDAE